MLPSKRPSWCTIIWLPRGRGADPQVDTTVASAMGAPRHSIALRITASLSFKPDLLAGQQIGSRNRDAKRGLIDIQFRWSRKA
jgi:hypothetical protein